MRERRKKTKELNTTRKIMNVGRWPELLAQEKINKTKQRRRRR